MARGKGRVIESADTVDASLAGADTMGPVLSGATSIREVDAATDPATPATHAIDLESGTRLGRYVVLAPLGSGGMSRVYRAFDPKLGRQLALKVVTPRRGHGWSADDERARVVREAQAIAKLTHPNVVAVHDVGVEGEIVFIAMELVGGRTLREWQRGGRPWREVVAMYLQAGRGLAAAHAAGLVHRDFKPENVLVGDDGRARVVDFGLARTAGDPIATPTPVDLEGEPVSVSQPLSPLTRAGTILGTPGYMAPEQYSGGDTDDRSDQFSFCVALFEALWGKRPFPGKTVAEVRQQVLDGSVTEIRGGPPARVRNLILRGLRVARDERHPSMAILLADLERAASPRRIGLAVGAFAAALAVAGGTALAVGSRSESASPCGASARRLDGVWDNELRDQLGALFAGGTPARAAIWPRVRGDLDGFAGAWIGKHREVCEATHHGEQSEQALDLRMACLGRQLAEVREVTALLASGDAATLDRAAVASRHLPDVRDCDDLRALEQVTRPPTDVVTRSQLGAAESLLARARALADAGKLSDARTTAERGLALARRLAYAPVLARALYTRGLVARLEGDGAAGRTFMFEALTRAEEAGDDALAALTSAELIFIAGYLGDAPDDGLAFSRLAAAILQRIGGRDAVAAMLHNNLGVLHMQGQRYPESVAELERGLALREKVYGNDAFDVVASLNNLGSALTELGRNQEARADFDRAARILDSLFGPVHPHRAAVLVNLALAETELGLTDQALAHYREAASIYEKVVGKSHPLVAPALTNQADLLADLGDFAAAVPLYQRALAIRVAANGEEHPSVALAHLGLGTALRQAGQLDASGAELDRAIRTWEKLRGHDDPDVARALHQLGIVRLAQRRYPESATALERALAIDEKALGHDHRALVPVLTSLGQLRLATGNLAGATGVLERALGLAEARALPTVEAALARFSLADALWRAPAQRGRARELAEAARDGYASIGKLGAADVARVDVWLSGHPAPPP